MNEELESLLIRLLGDASEYQKMLADATASTKDSSAEIQKSLNGVEKGVGELTKTVAGAIAAIGGLAIMKDALGNFQEAETIGLRLSAVLENNGRDVKKLTDDYNKFAVALEKTTTMEDDQILKLLASAEAFGSTGEQAKKAVKDAIGLAAITESSADSMLKLTNALAKGDTETAMMFIRAVPMLRQFKTETEFAAKAQGLITAGLSLAEKQTKSSAGAVKMLSRDYGNMTEDLGKLVAEGIQPAISKMAEMVALFRETPAWVKQVTVGFLAVTAATGTLVAGIALVTKALPALIAAWGLLTAATVANPWAPVIIVLAAMAVGLYALGKAAYAARKDVKEFNAAMEEGNKLQSRIVSLQIKRTDTVLEKAATMERPERKTFLQEELAKAKKELEGYNNGVKNAEKNLKAVNTIASQWLEPSIIRTVTNELEDQNRSLDAGREAVARITEELARLDDSKATTKANEEAKELEKSLKLQMATIGMTADEAAIYKLEFDGATEAALANARAIAAFKKESEDAFKIKEEVKEFTKSLREQIVTLGMTSNEIELYKLKMKGATAEDLKAATVKARMLEKQQKQYDLMARGEEITKEFATPAEKFASVQEELNELLDEGWISAETYAKALNKAAEAMNELKAAGRDAVKSGSLEAAIRREEYREAIGMGRGRMSPMGEPNRVVDNRNGAMPAGADRKDNSEKLLKEIRDALVKNLRKQGVLVEPMNLENN